MDLVKRTACSKIFDWINVGFLLLFSIIMLYPLVYVISIAVSDSNAVTLGKVVIWPVGFDLTAFRITLVNPSIWNAYKNTVIYVALGTGLTLFLNTMAAYPLSRKQFYGRKVLMVYFAVTMFFGGGLIPAYLLINKLQMINTIWVMIIPSSVTAWNIILFRTNFQAIPESLIESVQIDGGNAFQIYYHVILPLSKPIIATIALFTMVAKWNDFFTALIYINDIHMIPLQNYLRSLIVESNYEEFRDGITFISSQGSGKNSTGLMESVKMAAIIVSLGPILLTYPFVQKYFVKGVLIGSIKG